jgi:predicted AlkP superfamily pyrophosphatase or phosphodiesterase
MRCLLLGILLIAPAFAGPAKHVLLISIDGMRPDAMMEAEMPNLKKLIARGAHSLEARTVMPSITLTSHVSMVTGLSPKRHKVLWNEWKPEKGAISSRTIFDIAKDAGLRTALFAGKPKFKHLDRGGLDVCEVPDYSAREVAARAAQHIRVRKPNLIMVHFADPDGAGHAVGWMTDEYMEALGRADAAVGHLVEALEVAGIADSTAILVSTDHGGHDRTHGTDMPEDMTIPWIAAGPGVRPRKEPLEAGIVTYDTAATALTLLGLPVPEKWDGKAVASALQPVSGAGAPGSPPAAAR